MNLLKNLAWQKASFSHPNEDCVELALTEDGQQLAIRDSKDPDKEPHIYTPREGVAFLKGVKEGEFDSIQDALQALIDAAEQGETVEAAESEPATV